MSSHDKDRSTAALLAACGAGALPMASIWGLSVRAPQRAGHTA